jgi:hypothetical protein
MSTPRRLQDTPDFEELEISNANDVGTTRVLRLKRLVSGYVLEETHRSNSGGLRGYRACFDDRDQLRTFMVEGQTDPIVRQSVAGLFAKVVGRP